MFTRLNDALRVPEKNACVLLAASGMGKSVFAAELAKRERASLVL
jgi:2-phosphoglycerate kinase